MEGGRSKRRGEMNELGRKGKRMRELGNDAERARRERRREGWKDGGMGRRDGDRMGTRERFKGGGMEGKEGRISIPVSKHVCR